MHGLRSRSSSKLKSVSSRSGSSKVTTEDATIPKKTSREYEPKSKKLKDDDVAIARYAKIVDDTPTTVVGVSMAK